MTTTVDNAPQRPGYRVFAIKALILSAALCVALLVMAWVLLLTGAVVARSAMHEGMFAARAASAAHEAGEIVKRPNIRFRLIGLSTGNPAVHWKVADIYERDDRLDRAVDEIELAIGLLELHSSPAEVRNRYATRLADLRRSLEQRASAAPGR